MPKLPLIALADDLTGAAEIAAIAHQAGLRAVVYTTPPNGPREADIMIFDTDTRLEPPERAARHVTQIARKLRALPHDGFFKKTDSVLRGPVLAEAQACATALGLPRVLLVPCNPSLARVIQDGKYFVAGKPLHKTAFARDPHHPRHTSDVRTLLSKENDTSISCLLPPDRMPLSGVIVGEADSPADVTLWARKTDAETLPAGGADFFREWLLTKRTANFSNHPTAFPSGAALLISGTAAPNDPVSPLPGALIGIDPGHIPSVATLVRQVRTALENGGTASLHAQNQLVSPAPSPVLLGRTFARVATSLRTSDSFRNLFIAGGATAAGVLHALKWSELKVIRVWGAGVVTLQPVAAPEFSVTLKPGSYPWPASLIDYSHSLLSVA